MFQLIDKNRYHDCTFNEEYKNSIISIFMCPYSVAQQTLKYWWTSHNIV